MTRLLLAAMLIVLAACSSNVIQAGTPSPAPNSASSSANVYWVCHGGRHPKWKKVSTSALNAHRRHGDRIVTTPHTANTSCSQ